MHAGVFQRRLLLLLLSEATFLALLVDLIYM